MKEELKVIIDTNIFVSCLIGKSKTFTQIYEAFLNGKFTPILSLKMEIELMEVIKRPEFKRYFSLKEINRFEKLIKTDSILVPFTEDIKICRDPKDDIIFECAISSPVRPEYIVTGDKDLLCLKTFRKIPIISPKEFLKILKKK